MGEKSRHPFSNKPRKDYHSLDETSAAASANRSYLCRPGQVSFALMLSHQLLYCLPRPSSTSPLFRQGRQQTMTATVRDSNSQGQQQSGTATVRDSNRQGQQTVQEGGQGQDSTREKMTGQGAHTGGWAILYVCFSRDFRYKRKLVVTECVRPTVKSYHHQSRVPMPNASFCVCSPTPPLLSSPLLTRGQPKTSSVWLSGCLAH